MKWSKGVWVLYLLWVGDADVLLHASVEKNETMNPSVLRKMIFLLFSQIKSFVHKQ